MPHRLPLLLAALVTACRTGDGTAPDDSPLDTDCICCDFESELYEREESWSLTDEEVSAWAGEDGWDEEDCVAACEDAWAYDDEVWEGVTSCELTSADEEDANTLHCTWEEWTYCEGRAHAAVTPVGSGAGRSLLGAWLARAAQAEAGSVLAFRVLARELEALGAPEALIERARSAAREEAGHAGAMTRLAKAHGGRPEPVERRDLAPRSLEELAVENAREGCVGETWAALVARWQGEHAEDEGLRRVMRRIAVEEAGHAQLAWDLHAWALTQLDEGARARVEKAQSEAFGALVEGAARSVPEALARPSGLPGGEEARRLAESLRSALTMSPAAA